MRSISNPQTLKLSNLQTFKHAKHIKPSNLQTFKPHLVRYLLTQVFDVALPRLRFDTC